MFWGDKLTPPGDFRFWIFDFGFFVQVRDSIHREERQGRKEFRGKYGDFAHGYAVRKITIKLLTCLSGWVRYTPCDTVQRI